jgi:tight adherence protein C
MGSAELLLIGGLLILGVAVYMFADALFSAKVDAQALSWATGNEPVKSQSSLINLARPLLHQFALKYAVRIKAPGYRRSVNKKILTAGLSAELNVDEFIGLQLLFGLFVPLLLVLLNFALELQLPYAVCAGVGLAGVAFPHFHANAYKGSRFSSIIADLPFFIDLMALSTAAGLTFIGALQRITEKAQGSVLASEFEIVLQEIKLGSSRAKALRDLAERLDIAEVTSFCNMVIDADSTGTSIAQVLKDQAVQMRLERMVRAEKAGARASQMLLIPLMIFILPAVFIMVFAPMMLQFIYGGPK